MRAGASIKHEFRLANNDTMIQVSAERFAAVDADEYKTFHNRAIVSLISPFTFVCVSARVCEHAHDGWARFGVCRFSRFERIHLFIFLKSEWSVRHSKISYLYLGMNCLF